jgi:FkbM family methyltransferase
MSKETPGTMTDPSIELELVLSEPIESVKHRERTTFDEACGERGQIVLHGAGRLGRKALAGLRALGREPIAFTDSREDAWGGQVDGVDVLSPVSAAERFGGTATFVVCIWSPGEDRTHAVVSRALRHAGCHSVVSFIPLFWKHPDRFLPHYRIDLPHKFVEASAVIREVFGLLADDRSRAEFVRQVQWLTATEVTALPVESTIAETYFPKSVFSVTDREAFVDCGAFDGDTLRTYLETTGCRFDHATCFEPDPINFKALLDYVGGLPEDTSRRIDLRFAAVGSEVTTVRIEPTGTVTSNISSTGSTEVPCVRLDDELQHAPTYIKMDIEGFEPLALQGAMATIQSHTPRLAICVYHEQDHLWRLVDQVRSYSAGYSFYLRRHGDQFGDVVAYAVPKN